MIAVSLACAPAFLSGMIVQRWEGVLFMAYYLAYLAHLVLAATGHPAQPLLDGFVLSVMVPMTALAVLANHQSSENGN
jgi:cation:H+ antiporter